MLHSYEGKDARPRQIDGAESLLVDSDPGIEITSIFHFSLVRPDRGDLESLSAIHFLDVRS